MNTEPISGAYIADPKIANFFTPDIIGDAVKAANFPETILRFRNDRAARTVGLDTLNDAQWITHFGKFLPLPGNLPEPVALRYHGHQFRHYNPDIGDGRGFVFAQLRDSKGHLLDLGTKGSGTTPYSRSGDGRLTLKGGMREILATEMLEALGVNTSKTFSLIETGEQLMRGDEPSPTRSAVMVRLSHGHIRFGTFQRIAAENNAPMMHRLIEYCLRHLYDAESDDNPAAQLLELATERMAEQAASYMVAGFVHGVLNTDNMNITGESFDYGPWRFTPRWDAGFTAAYFDHQGLYAFGRQAEAIHWNLGQLAVSLRLISDAPQLIAALERFPALFQSALVRRFLWRLGVSSQGEEADRILIEAAERAMIGSDITIDTFFHAHRSGNTDRRLTTTQEYLHWVRLYQQYRSAAPPHDYWQDNQPCSMHAGEVESIWDAIDSDDNWQPLYDKIATIRRMGAAHYMLS